MERFEAAYGRWVVRHRWPILMATLVLLIAAASGARFLTFNNDLRAFFSDKNPQLQALETLENTYNKNTNVLFVIAPADGDVFTRKTLAAVEEMTEECWQMPYSSRVNSITNYQHTEVVDDDLIVDDLVRDASALSDADLKRIRTIAIHEPQLVNDAVSESGHVTAISVNALLPGKSLDEVPEVTLFARDLIVRYEEKYPGLEIHLTGGIVFDNAFAEVSQKDISTLVPIMFVVLVVITGLSLRSLVGTFGTLLVILFSALTGLGMAGWLGILLTSASVNAPTIILTLAVADSVHILVTFFSQFRQGKSRHDAIAESLRVNLQPVMLTSITTAIGFLSMNVSDAPPFRDLGNMVAIGVVAAFFYSVLFLPALLAILPIRVKTSGTDEHDGWTDALARFVIARRKIVLWGTTLFIVLLTAGIARIELNDDWVNYFDDSYDIRTSSDFAEENLTGFDIIEYSLYSGESGGINDPEYLATIEAFARWYEEQPNVVHISTITNTMKRLNMNMHGNDVAYYAIPERRDLAAQYLLLYEMSLPFGLDLNDQINVDKSATRMLVNMKGMTTNSIREMDEQARDWLRENAPESMLTYGSGLSIIWAHISERNIKSMLGASFGALILISVILIFALRSFKLGAISLIPNMAPAFMAFGVWGLTVGRVGLALSVIVAMTLGIVVDDTVHFMSKYIRARREHGMGPRGAVRYAFKTVGRALWITTIALVAGFLVLTLSGFKMNSDMGMMTAITISIALVLDFLFLPALLMRVEEKADETSHVGLDTLPGEFPASGGGGDS